MLVDLWKIMRKAFQGLADEGLYEVLEYESTLELKDTRGVHATFHKREKVHYLQNNIIAHQDQAWADGEFLLDYRCTPGVPVDRYRLGRKTYILISLREVKNRGDTNEFNIQWGLRRSFMSTTGFWETEISHRTRHVKIEVIFPRDRPPLRLSVVEGTRQRAYPLGVDAPAQLPNGRWLVSWETSRPRLYERYLLKWEW